MCPMYPDQSCGLCDPWLLPTPASLSGYMNRPWWLLLSFSLCNVVFHAFLPDLLDQHYSLCPSAPSPSFISSISSLHWFDTHGEEQRTGFSLRWIHWKFGSWCTYWLSFASNPWSLSRSNEEWREMSEWPENDITLDSAAPLWVNLVLILSQILLQRQWIF